MLGMTKHTEDIENIGMTLQEVITRNMRIALGYNGKRQSDLARAFGVSRVTVSQKMTGKINWTIEDMEKAGRYLGIEPAWFLRAHEISEPQLVGPLGLEPRTGGL
ncbi:helix-turn-helix domain-containing protein [Bifidobacterium pseudolongum subsp. globosum]|uniref:helix-turn-helix domain-containing protein n=1 Tax=Bifidobacterium pseudolongum TaxID=1694 RepID=UPI003991619C